MGVDPHFLQLLNGFSGVATAARPSAPDFFASVADEDEIDFVFETIGVLNVFFSNRGSAEQSDVREFVEVAQGDQLGLHTAHRQASHGTIGLIG